MGHVRKECGCDGFDYCGYCDGGLFTCAKCDASEGELTTHCPGAPIPYETRQRVYSRELDFVDGRWITYKGEVI